MTEEQTPQLWDAEAAAFDDEPDHGLRDLEVRDAWRRLLAAHLPPPPARVADLGCGTGSLALLLAEDGYDVDGVDFSPRMVEAARTKVASRTGVSVVVGDAARPPLRPAAYDTVLCRHVLWALPDPAAALDRWVTLLAPSGRLLLVEGQWHTGAGLTADRAVALVEGAGRRAELVRLDAPVYWGGPTGDERYLVVSGS